MREQQLKRGRPLESPEPRDQPITFRLNQTELDSLSAYAWRYDRSVSDVIREALMVLSVIPDNPTNK